MEDDRTTPVSDEDIAVLSKEIGEDWEKFARLLPDESESRTSEWFGDGSNPYMIVIETDYEGGERCATVLLKAWVGVCPALHRWGLLWDALQSFGLGRLARRLMEKRSNSKHTKRNLSL